MLKLLLNKSFLFAAILTASGCTDHSQLFVCEGTSQNEKFTYSLKLSDEKVGSKATFTTQAYPRDGEVVLSAEIIKISFPKTPEFIQCDVSLDKITGTGRHECFAPNEDGFLEIQPVHTIQLTCDSVSSEKI